jgi:hypothetical protein
VIGEESPAFDLPSPVKSTRASTQYAELHTPPAKSRGTDDQPPSAHPPGTGPTVNSNGAVSENIAVAVRTASKRLAPQKFVLPSFPTVTITGCWLKETSSACTAATQSEDSLEYGWVLEVNGKTYKQLATSGLGESGEHRGRFTMLDNALPYALAASKAQWVVRIRDKVDEFRNILVKLP